MLPSPRAFRRQTYAFDRRQQFRQSFRSRVEQFFDNRDINAEPCHTAGDGAPDVVQDPLRHRRRMLIDPALYQMSAAPDLVLSP
jgi:hypothetical protein